MSGVRSNADRVDSERVHPAHTVQLRKIRHVEPADADRLAGEVC